VDILSVKNLTKSFNGTKAVDNLSFTVPEGTIFGFVGPNGAGKTTTMKMILGLLKPDEGKAVIDGTEVKYGETKTNEVVGYLPDVPEFYSYLKPKEYLKLCADITGMPSDLFIARQQELLHLVGLDNVNKKIGSFSRGMKQRLGIAQALLNEPKLLICDEPTSALDPVGRKEILDILLAVKGRTTVIFSTHILSDVERICDHVVVLKEGKLVLSGSVSELKNQHHNDRLFLEFETDAEAELFLKKSPFAIIGQLDRHFLIGAENTEKTKADILNWLVKANLYPKKFEVLEPTVESLFLEAVK